jgi:hypothetical protein
LLALVGVDDYIFGRCLIVFHMVVFCRQLLQSLANNQPFGMKEDYMVDVNEFITRNLEPLQEAFVGFIKCPSRFVVYRDNEDRTSGIFNI